MSICAVCGKLNAAGSRNCDLCGAPLANESRQRSASPVAEPAPGPSEALSGPICPVCRRSNRSISVFCAFCGYRLKPAATGNGAQPYALPSVGAPPARAVPVTIPSDESGNIPSGTVLKRRYRILRKIAQGGMGAVYECTDMQSHTGARWAVKEMSPAALPASERTQAISDFRREAQMLASLRHPNLPTVLETFEELGKHFLVMEFVGGRTLQNVIDNTPGFIPEERIMVWARQVFDVIAYLHSQDPPIIYRDMKPANVMLLEGTERIKLIDFGIARFHKAGKNRDTEAFGTAGYAPPEQYGKGQTDQRSDVYALAATLHYLATKHDPGLNPFNWLPARQYNSAISAQMESALQRALNLDPQKRFPSIWEFAAALGVTGISIHQANQMPAEVSRAAPAPAPVPQPVPVQTPAAAPASRSSRQRNTQSRSNTASQPKAPARQKQGAQPRPQPAPVPVAPAASMAVPAQAAVSIPVAPPVELPHTPTEAVRDHGTMSTATPTSRPTPSSTSRPTGKADPPALVVSDHMVDLGEAKWNHTPVRRISLLNVGGGVMKGTVKATQPWVALNVQSFRGNTQTIEVRVKKRDLLFGRVELHVPNLFAIIWTRARWALPFIGLWFWVLFLAANSLGRWLVWGVLALAAGLVLAEVLMWWWALHVRLLVPAERLNSGRLLVQSSGGEQQIELRVKARPSWARKAIGWTLAGLLMAAELGAVVWIVLTLAGYSITLPGLW